MKRIEKHSQVLEALTRIPPTALSTVVTKLEPDVIRALAEITTNILENNVQMTKTQKQKLKKFKTPLRNIKACCHKTVPINKVRKIVKNQRGGFLPAVIAPILPLIGKAVLSGVVAGGAGLVTKKLLDDE